MEKLSKSQEKLKGKAIKNMSNEELDIWIDACNIMENSVDFNKARRSWTSSREEAILERNAREAKNESIRSLFEVFCEEMKEMNENEIKEYIKEWRYNFNGHKLSSSKKEHNWHVFSYNYHRNYVSEKEADLKYQSQYVKNFVIIGSNKIGYKCSSNKLPDLIELKKFISRNEKITDFYITHSNFKWTYVITHEDDFGPYFATKENGV